MPLENYPTQPDGQEEVINPTINPRNAALSQIAKAAHASVSAELSGFNEDTGEIEAKTDKPDEPSQEIPETRQEIAQDTDKPEPPAPKMVAIVVDGQTIEVEESRIIEAGKRTLQKDHAADRRLQEAAHTKRQAEALLAQAQRLSIPDGAGSQEPTPPQDASQPAQQQSFDPVAIDTYLENKLYMRDANKAAERFKADFADIASDPHLMNMAANLETQRLNTAAALGESFGDPFEAYRKHGEAVRQWLQERTGTKPVQAAQSMNDKTERKRSITVVQAVNAKAPTPAAPKVLSIAEQIEQMRETRTRGRVIQRTQ